MTGIRAKTEEPPESQISYDERFDLLSNHRRRYILYYLQQTGDTVTLGDLAEQIAAWENEIKIKELTYDQRKRVYTSLQQVHLPRMDDAHVVEFDDRRGTVEIGPAAENLDVYLEVVEGGGIPWSYLYLGLAVVNVAVIGSSAAGIWPLAALPELGVPTIVAASFFVTSLVHLYVTRTEMQPSKRDEPPTLTE